MPNEPTTKTTTSYPLSLSATLFCPDLSTTLRIHKFKFTHLLAADTDLSRTHNQNPYNQTSNVTGRQRGPKRKLRVGVALCSIFLQILLIFSLPEGYRLQVAISRAYFVYTLWHSTGQHYSSISPCTYRLFAGMWRP